MVLVVVLVVVAAAHETRQSFVGGNFAADLSRVWTAAHAPAVGGRLYGAHNADFVYLPSTASHG